MGTLRTVESSAALRFWSPQVKRGSRRPKVQMVHHNSVIEPWSPPLGPVPHAVDPTWLLWLMVRTLHRKEPQASGMAWWLPPHTSMHSFLTCRFWAWEMSSIMNKGEMCMELGFPLWMKCQMVQWRASLCSQGWHAGSDTTAVCAA